MNGSDGVTQHKQPMKEEESELLKVLIRKERELGSFSFRGEGWVTAGL
jgi:hypothetical protein